MQKSDRSQPILTRLPFQTAPALGLLLLAVDFTTKATAVARLPLNQRLPTFLPFLHWRLTYNSGSHYLFGSIGEHIPYRLMMGVAGVLVCGLAYMLAREGHRMRPSRWRAVQWFLVAFLIGALGNALEVVFLGRATDFFMLDPFPWPANLADQWVNATVFVLLPLSLWFSWKEEQAPMPPAEPELSIILTAFREERTIGAAIEGLLPQIPENAELLVVCPDLETGAVVADYASRYPIVRYVPDPQKGKPHALNLGLQAARGEIVVLSDGDVVVAVDALAPLLAPFRDPEVGAVSGRPISASPRETMLGYWSHLLTDAAHQVRLDRDRIGEFLVCTGYLYAFRRSLIQQVPEDALAEDAVISHLIAGKGYRIRYAPTAQVAVKYPSTYEDWLRQKVRSAGGYTQELIRESPQRMRSMQLEVVQGSRFALRYARNGRELLWSVLLFAARLHLWWLILLNVRWRRRPLQELWQRVETTK